MSGRRGRCSIGMQQESWCVQETMRAVRLLDAGPFFSGMPTNKGRVGFYFVRGSDSWSLAHGVAIVIWEYSRRGVVLVSKYGLRGQKRGERITRAGSRVNLVTNLRVSSDLSSNSRKVSEPAGSSRGNVLKAPPYSTTVLQYGVLLTSSSLNCFV